MTDVKRNDFDEGDRALWEYRQEQKEEASKREEEEKREESFNRSFEK